MKCIGCLKKTVISTGESISLCNLQIALFYTRIRFRKIRHFNPNNPDIFELQNQLKHYTNSENKGALAVPTSKKTNLALPPPPPRHSFCSTLWSYVVLSCFCLFPRLLCIFFANSLHFLRFN